MTKYFLPVLTVLTLFTALPSYSQQTTQVRVSASIGEAIPRCLLSASAGGLNFGTVSLPGTGLTGIATIDPTGATDNIAYVTNETTPQSLPNPTGSSVGQLSVTAFNSSQISVTSTFPSSLPSTPALDPPVSLSYTGTWAVSTTQSGTYTAQSGNYTATGSGASWERYFRFGGQLTVPNTTPVGVFTSDIEISATCTDP